MNYLGLFQLIDKPIRIADNSNTIIDSIFTYFKSSLEIVGLFITYISDQLHIFSMYNTCITSNLILTKQNYITFRLLN